MQSRVFHPLLLSSPPRKGTNCDLARRTVNKLLQLILIVMSLRHVERLRQLLICCHLDLRGLLWSTGNGKIFVLTPDLPGLIDRTIMPIVVPVLAEVFQSL